MGQFSGNSPCKNLPSRVDEGRCGAHMSKLSERCRFFTLRWGGTLAIGLFVAFLVSLAMPNFVTRGSNKTHAIESNLRQLDGAVAYWGIEHHQTGAVAVTWKDVAPYLKADPEVNGGMKSVAGEVYVLKT